MKKIVLILLLLLSTFSVKSASAEVDGEFYGKINSTSAYLFSSADTASLLFLLPNTYFVKILDVEDDFYEVNYKDLTGYVLKNDVRLMEGSPNTPYLNLSVTNYTSYCLYENPSTNSSAFCELAENSTLSYYGSINGEEISNRGDEWHYVSAAVDGVVHHGYIFSEVTDILTIPQNSETFPEVDESALYSSTPEFSSLSTGTKVLLIVAITVPSAFILFFLIKPNKLSKRVAKPEKKVRKVHHGDYFEFDDTDL